MSIYEKILKIQNTLKAPKSKYNAFGKYNYRSTEDILEGVKPLLAEEGLFLSICDEIVLVGDRYYVKAVASITDGENRVSTTAYAREELDKKGMDASQITGSASTYARKYALNGLFCIDDTKDADSMDNSDNTQDKKRSYTDAEYKDLLSLVEKTGHSEAAMLKQVEKRFKKDITKLSKEEFKKVYEEHRSLLEK